MKHVLIATAIVAGLTMTSVARADDPEDKLIELHSKVTDAVMDARSYSDGYGSVVLYEEPVAIFVVGKNWDEVAEVLMGEKEIKNRLSVK